MGKINILSELVANKIAAGEVVERPASIVKELMENALDAGARHIAVSIGYGGKSHIRVRDDGCGMDREDAQACLLRHATSKMSRAEDIEHIGTLGFRGEALPSIASVSRLTLITREQRAETATLVKTAGGVIASVSEAVCDPGTAIDVADLFFNTPARKKFLKSDAAEYNAIADIFNTLALSRMDVAFSLEKNGVEAADYAACGSMRERIEQLYGGEFAEKLYPITLAKADFRLTGYIGSPDSTRINRTGQKFFINTRPVQSPALHAALSRAYAEFLTHGRFPVAVLFLDIDPSDIDVNVHPAKREVRIRNERFFQDAIVRAVKAELQQKGFFFSHEAGSANAPAREKYVYGETQSRFSFGTLNEASAAWEAPLRRAGPPGEAALPVEAPGRTAAPPAIPDGVRGKNLQDNPFQNSSVIGQTLGTYILAEKDGTLFVFDQHAAHERILYEELLASITGRPAASQALLFPATLHLSLEEASVMEKQHADFQRMGFSINPLGGGSFSIDAVPACLPAADAAALVQDSLHALMEHAPASSWETRQRDLAAILACKTYAVKAGKKLDAQEMEHLIRTLGEKENPHICPHGRPTFFPVSQDELERRFKRK